MSEENSKSQDPEARRRRRRRRRGPRVEGGPGEGERPQERAPERAQERPHERAPERTQERPQERAPERTQERAARGPAAADPGAAGDARRRRRRRRRPREEGEAAESAGTEARESAGAETRASAGAETRASAGAEARESAGAESARGTRTRRSRRRGSRPTGSQTPGADLQTEGGREDGDEDTSADAAGQLPAQPRDRTAGRGGAGLRDQRRTRPAAAASGDADDDRDDDDLDDDDADDDRDEYGDHRDTAEHDRAFDRDADDHAGPDIRDGQIAAFLRSESRGPKRRGEEALPPSFDASDSEQQEEPSGVWAVEDPTRDAGRDDDDASPVLPVRESVHHVEPPADDPDPATWVLDQADEVADERALDRPVHNVVGIKFASAGRIYLYDAGDDSYTRGEEVVVDTERGLRTGVVAVTSVRRVHTRGELRAVLRRPSANDRRTSERNDERCNEAVQAAREIVRTLDLPMKVFRSEYVQSGKKAVIYFTAEERIDFRDLVRDLSKQLRCRVEMRQTGVRDEAKQVGGIGSCGRELCCTTWLPEFVPVSIKMAKDQGLVLNPTKVSGQCGRLKCCLVYEQDTYAAMRKGLPKLGKRVITTDGEEGRVVEVDVLRQRVRVTLGPGEFRVLTAEEIRPMFPSQSQKPLRPGERPESPDSPERPE
jgi:cell fate regulator YaaT (PSP1 superfamily)